MEGAREAPGEQRRSEVEKNKAWKSSRTNRALAREQERPTLSQC